MRHLDGIFRKTNQVICLVQPVLAFIGADRLIDLIERRVAEILQLFQFQGLRLAAYSRINTSAVSLSGRADNIHKLLSVAIHIRLTNRPEKIQGLFADLHIALDQLAQESHIPTHVTQRHHRCAVAHQCIVCIIPFGTERVHPDTRFGNEIRQFGQQRNQQLIRHRSPIDLSLLVQNQFGVRAHLRYQRHDTLV